LEELDEILKKYNVKIKSLELELTSYDKEIFFKYKIHKFTYKVIFISKSLDVFMKDDSSELREFL
jgi:hypothetical protein